MSYTWDAGLLSEPAKPIYVYRANDRRGRHFRLLSSPYSQVDGPPGPDGVATKVEYRVWNPFRSKLAAAILGGAYSGFCWGGVRQYYRLPIDCGLSSPNLGRSPMWVKHQTCLPPTNHDPLRHPPNQSGVDHIWMGPGSKVLYLGAASGTTVSHVADIVGA